MSEDLLDVRSETLVEANAEEFGPQKMQRVGQGIDSRGAVADNPLFISALFQNKGLRVLTDFFLSRAEEDKSYSKAALVRETSLARQTVIDNVDELVRFGVCLNAGSEERPRYQLNPDAPSSQILWEANRVLAMYYDANRI